MDVRQVGQRRLWQLVALAAATLAAVGWEKATGAPPPHGNG
jgi:hypothetical protein